MLGAADKAVDVEVPVLPEVLVRLYRHRQPRGVGAVKGRSKWVIRRKLNYIDCTLGSGLCSIVGPGKNWLSDKTSVLNPVGPTNL